MLRSRFELPNGEEGFTLIEMMVAMLVSIMLLLMTSGFLTVFIKAEASTVNNANQAALARIVLLQFQHDVQSANPLETLGTVAQYNDELQLSIQPSGAVITWLYSPLTQELTRQINSGSPVVLLSNVTNGDPSNGGLPVFNYFDHCAINQVNEAQATPASVSSASTVVQITLSVVGISTAPYGTTTTVSILEKPPGASQCG